MGVAMPEGYHLGAKSGDPLLLQSMNTSSPGLYSLHHKSLPLLPFAHEAPVASLWGSA